MAEDVLDIEFLPLTEGPQADLATSLFAQFALESVELPGRDAAGKSSMEDVEIGEYGFCAQAWCGVRWADADDAKAVLDEFSRQLAERLPEVPYLMLAVNAADLNKQGPEGIGEVATVWLRWPATMDLEGRVDEGWNLSGVEMAQLCGQDEQAVVGRGPLLPTMAGSFFRVMYPRGVESVEAMGRGQILDQRLPHTSGRKTGPGRL